MNRKDINCQDSLETSSWHWSCESCSRAGSESMTVKELMKTAVAIVAALKAIYAHRAIEVVTS